MSAKGPAPVIPDGTLSSDNGLFDSSLPNYNDSNNNNNYYEEPGFFKEPQNYQAETNNDQLNNDDPAAQKKEEEPRTQSRTATRLGLGKNKSARKDKELSEIVNQNDPNKILEAKRKKIAKLINMDEKLELTGCEKVIEGKYSSRHPFTHHINNIF
jgi:hypothetical protein